MSIVREYPITNNHPADTRLLRRYYFVFIVVLLLFGLTAFFSYPETRGHTLEQMAVIFDGERAQAPPAEETACRARSIAREKDDVYTTVHEEG